MAVDPTLALGLMYFCRYCPKHREEQMVERAKIKEQLTGTKTQSSKPNVSRKFLSTKDSAQVTHHHTKLKALPKHDLTKSRISSPKTPTPVTNSKSKVTNGSSPHSESKRPRRDTPSIYSNNSMDAGDEDGHDSPKRARKSSNSQATIEEIRVLKEYKWFPNPFSSFRFLPFPRFIPLSGTRQWTLKIIPVLAYYLP